MIRAAADRILTCTWKQHSFHSRIKEENNLNHTHTFQQMFPVIMVIEQMIVSITRMHQDTSLASHTGSDRASFALFFS